MRRAALIGTSFVVVVAAALVMFLLGSGGSLRFAGPAAPWTDVDGPGRGRVFVRFGVR